MAPGLPFSPVHSPQPISPTFTSPTSLLFSPPTAQAAPLQNVLIGSGGHVRVADPLELVGLSAHQPASPTAFQHASASNPLVHTSTSVRGSAPEESSQSAQVIDQAKLQDGAQADKQKSGGRRRAHGRNKSDIGTAKKVSPEQDRRKSTAPGFPSRDQERKSSIPPSIKVSPASPTRKRTVPRDDSEQVDKAAEAAIAATDLPDSSDLPRGDVGKGASRVKPRRAFTEIGNQADEKQPIADSVKQRRASEPTLSASADAILTSPRPAKEPKQPEKGESQRRSDLEQASLPETSRLSPGGDFSDATSPPSPSASTASSSTPVSSKASKGKRRWKRRGKKQAGSASAGQTDG